MSERSEFRYFSQSDLWSRGPVSEQLAVADDLISLVPDCVSTILDAGCGNGTVTNLLHPRWRVVGCDLSETAIKHVAAPALVADLCAIPFPDRQFDLVLSSDVIEHLPDSIYTRALAEIARVSSRYILVAVPYREILKAAEVNCPACGARYHAHLHQRSYSVADVVDLFAPDFAAVDVRLSGEPWIFEDQWLVEAARNFSGLDYPFEDGVCPECSSRRGYIEQPDSSKRILRRFEALQAMQVAEGIREIPDSSEILVLFERGAVYSGNFTLSKAEQSFCSQAVSWQELTAQDNPVNYPRGVRRIKSDADYGVLSIPRRPKTIHLVAGSVDAVEVYDHVRCNYVICPTTQQGLTFQIPPVPFGPHGCILRMLHPSDDLHLHFEVEATELSEILNCCLGDDPMTSRVRESLHSLSMLAEERESARSSLEILLQEKEKKLDEHAQAMAVLNALANELERKRSEIESSFTRLSLLSSNQEKQLQSQSQRLSDLLTEYCRADAERKELHAELMVIRQQDESHRIKIEELSLALDQANQLACRLELSRDALEAGDKRWQFLFGQLEEKLVNMTCLANSLESRREELESCLRARDEQAKNLNEYANGLEAQCQLLESKIESMSITMEDLVSERDDNRAFVDAMRIYSRRDRESSAAPHCRVLILSHMYPREYNEVGGIFIHEQVKALRSQGIDARVVSGEPFWINTLNPILIRRAVASYRESVPSEWDEYDEVPVIRFPYIVSSLLPFQAHATTYSHGLMRFTNWLHSDFPFELVHAHTAYTDGSAGRRLAQSLNLPFVITEHTGPFSILTRTRYLRRVTQKSLNAADRVIAVSSALLSDIRKQIRLRSDIDARVVANLVDTEFFRAREKTQNGLINILWVGHFVPVKRVPVLLEAFATAFQSEPLLRLRLAGDGEGLADARMLADKLGILSVVEFVGRASREQLVDYYRECDFLVISSEGETFGVVAIEAMSSGRPVLTTNCGGPEDIITHPGLGHVVGMSVEALSDGLLFMARRRQDFRSNVIRKTAEFKYSGVSVARQLAAIYSELLLKNKFDL